MSIITIANKKGGVSKTTTTVSLGFAFDSMNKKVLIIDTDEQESASYLLKSNSNTKTIYDVIINNAKIGDSIQHYNNNLDFISGSNNLSKADFMLKDIKHREFLLKKVITPISDKYDYILIDTAPSLNTLTINALVCSDYLIIPTQADIFSLHGIGQLSKVINIIREKRNKNLKILGILVTRYDKRGNVSKEMYNQIKQAGAMLNTDIFQVEIRENIKIKESQALRDNLMDYKLSSGARDYIKLAREIIKKTEKDVKG